MYRHMSACHFVVAQTLKTNLRVQGDGMARALRDNSTRVWWVPLGSGDQYDVHSGATDQREDDMGYSCQRVEVAENKRVEHVKRHIGLFF